MRSLKDVKFNSYVGFYEWHIYDLTRSMNHGLWYVGKMYGDYLWRYIDIKTNPIGDCTSIFSKWCAKQYKVQLNENKSYFTSM